MNGELENALADLKEAIRIDPKNSESYNARANSYYAKRDFQSAIADLTEAIRLGRKTATAYGNRGECFWIKGDFDMASRDFGEAILLEPARPEWYYNQAVCRHLSGNPHGAMKRLEDAAKFASGEPYASFFGTQQIRGRLKPEPGQEPRLDPMEAVVCDALAWIFATCSDDQERDGERAVRNATIAADKTDREDGYYLDTLAAAYAEAGKFDEAVKWEKKAIELVRRDDEFLTGSRARLALYRDKKPYREPSRKASK